MELIIEKAFLDAFLVLELDNDKFWYEDFSRFLTKKAKDFILVTDFENLDELSNEFENNALWDNINENAANYQFDTSLNTTIEASIFYNTDSTRSIFKLFCTTKTDTECKALEEKYGYTYLNINTLKNKWAVYKSDRDDNSMPITNDTLSNPRFDDWSKIQAFRHPIRSMIIFDKYLFVNQVHQDIQQNLFELFKNLLADVALNQPLEVLFLVAKEVRGSKNIDKNNRIMLSSVSINDRIVQIGKYIEAFITTNYSNLQVNVSIVHYDKDEDLVADKEHDRGIYTNYFFFEIGAGINLFDSAITTKRSTLNSHFLLKLPGKNVGFSGLRSFRDYIQNVVTTHGASSVDYFYNYSGNNLLLDDTAIL